jgi:hypothetical protein
MHLCLTCGLCCDGTMFENVEVTPEEAARLEGRVNLSADRTKLVQGCRALEGCKCGVYEDRPAKCRSFSCFLLASLEAGNITEQEAREGVAEAMSRRDAVAKLMSDDDPRRALVAARKLAAEDKASDELKTALRRLKQLTLLMLMPADEKKV